MADFRTKFLDFANPLELNSRNVSLDYEDLIDNKSALISKNNSLDVYRRSNVFKGVTEYIGIIIQISTEEQYKPPGLTDLIQDPFGQETRQAFFKAHIPTLHASIGNPCDIGYLDRFGTSQEKLQAALKRIQNHPWYLATYQAGIFVNRAPAFGDLVKIKFLKNPSSGKMIQGEIVEIISRGNVDTLDALCDDNTNSLFGGYDPNYGKVDTTFTGLVSKLVDFVDSFGPVNSEQSGDDVAPDPSVYNGTAKNGEIKYIVVHHTASAPSTTLKTIAKWHGAKGITGIAYHKVIKPDGSINDTRPIDKRPGSQLNYNDGTLAVCLVGHFHNNQDVLREVQLQSLQRVLSEWSTKFPNAKIVGHRQIGDTITACPGDLLFDWLFKNYPSVREIGKKRIRR